MVLTEGLIVYSYRYILRYRITLCDIVCNSVSHDIAHYTLIIMVRWILECHSVLL